MASADDSVYLVGGGVQIGQGEVQEVVLQGVDARWDGQLYGLQGLVHDLVLQHTIQRLDTET